MAPRTHQHPSRTHTQILAHLFTKSAQALVTAALLVAQVFTLLQPRTAEAAAESAFRRGSVVRKPHQPMSSFSEELGAPEASQHRSLRIPLPDTGQAELDSEPNGLMLVGRTAQPLAPTDICQLNPEGYYNTCFIEATHELTVTVFTEQPENQALEVSCENGFLNDINSILCSDVERIIVEENPDVNGDTGYDLRGVTANDFENLLDTVIVAGGGADVIYGSQFDDYIFSDTEDPGHICFEPNPASCRDTIYPWEGNDVVHTGPGNDSTYNLQYFDNYGNDTVYADQGGDTITGGLGEDWLIHQSGQNMRMDINTVFVGAQDLSPIVDDITVLDVEGVHLTGDNNPNSMNGGTFIGSVFFEGLGQDDTLIGTSQADTLIGGDADDSLVGNDGIDWLQGDTGFDTLVAGKGSDTLLGGDQDDVFSDGQDAYEDSLMGGGGVDTFQDTLSAGASLIFSNTEYREQGGAIFNAMVEMEVIKITGSSGPDFIDCSAFSSQVTLDGGAGNDTLTGGDGSDLIFSLFGSNLLNGGAGDDVLFVGPGNDTLLGGAGFDDLDGGSGHDSLRGGSEADTLFGSEGDDKIIGDAGLDTLDGGRGNDTLYGGDGDDLLLMRDSGAKFLSGDGGSDTHQIPYYANTCGPGNAVTSRFITIQEPDNFNEIDQSIYYAGQAVDNIRILLNTLYRTSLTSCIYDRITLSPNLDSFTVSAMEGDDTFEIHPSIGIAYSIDGGPHMVGDHMDFYAPPGQFSSDEGDRVVTTGYRDVTYTEIESNEFFQDPWRLFMPAISR